MRRTSVMVSFRAAVDTYTRAAKLRSVLGPKATVSDVMRRALELGLRALERKR